MTLNGVIVPKFALFHQIRLISRLLLFPFSLLRVGDHFLYQRSPLFAAGSRQPRTPCYYVTCVCPNLDIICPSPPLSTRFFNNLCFFITLFGRFYSHRRVVLVLVLVLLLLLLLVNCFTSEATAVLLLPDHCDLTTLIDDGAEIRPMEAGDARRRAPTQQRHRPAVSTSNDG